MKGNGFSLIDLIVSLAIAGILFGAGLPSFYSLLERHNTTLAINKMVGAINYTRINAVTSGNTVTLCPRTEVLDCGKDWSLGAIVFRDLNSNGKIDGNETVLRVFDKFKTQSKATWVSFGSNNYLRFRADGTTIGQNGSFTYCPPNKNEKFAHQIIINRTGRVRLAEDLNGDGVRENTKGENLSCD